MNISEPPVSTTGSLAATLLLSTRFLSFVSVLGSWREFSNAMWAYFLLVERCPHHD
jgi:hypothetical protein